MDFAQNAFTGIMDFGQFIVDNWQVIVNAIAAIAAGMAAAKFAKFVTDIGSAISAATNLSTAISGISAVAPGLGSALSLLTNPVFLVAGAITGLVLLINQFGDQFQETLSYIDNLLTNVFAVDWTEQFGIMGNVVNGLFAAVEAVWNSIRDTLNGVIDFVRGVFTGDWERAWNGVVEIFSGIFGGIVNAVRVPFRAVAGIINTIIDAVNSISIDIPDWVPVVGGAHFGLNIPHIPYLADGGIVRRGSAIVGDAGPELMTVLGNRTIVQPLPSRYATAPGGQAAGAAVAPQITINVYGAEGQDENALAEIIMRKIQAATARKEDLWR